MPKQKARTDYMAERAAAGDLDGVLKLLSVSPFPEADSAEAMQYCRQALENITDPAELTRVLFARMLSFQGFLLTRTQHFINESIRANDTKYGGCSDLPENIAETWMPRLSAIQQSIRETGKCYASISHTLELAKGKFSPRTRTDGRVIRLNSHQNDKKQEAMAAGE